MKLFSIMAPVLASADVKRDIRWYSDNLGFKNIYDSNNYSFGTIDYAVLKRDNVLLHLQFQYLQDIVLSDIKIQVDAIEPIFHELIKFGRIRVTQLPKPTPWNTVEFAIKDLNGNRIWILQEL